jgi:hypothetical protein
MWDFFKKKKKYLNGRLMKAMGVGCIKTGSYRGLFCGGNRKKNFGEKGECFDVDIYSLYLSTY